MIIAVFARRLRLGVTVEQFVGGVYETADVVL